ncbi:Adhesion G-protein coupled receptor D1 [Exaiptasia diaphana]|nr:Adhesion G-protein coupled receptor D1 [Exaiptasia diaphana]
MLAVVQHYFHTAVFSWMLCEGLHLYFMLIKVFVVTKLYLIHSIIGWGLPVIVLVFTAAIQPSTYEMSTKHEVYQCGTQEIEITVKRNLKCIKCVAALLPLLGLVWLFGYTVNLHWILAYIFIVINSSQGIMIAIFHCVLDDQLMNLVADVKS